MSDREPVPRQPVLQWLAERKVPRPLRPLLYRLCAAAIGADLSDVRPPLDGYASVAAFLVRRPAIGARPQPERPDVLSSPADGLLRAVEQPGGDRPSLLVEAEVQRRSYRRVHAPLDSRLVAVEWSAPDARRGSEGPGAHGEARLTFETSVGPLVVELACARVGGRLRVVGVPAGGPLPRPRDVRRGDEIACFAYGAGKVRVLVSGAWRAVAASPTAAGTPTRAGEPLAAPRSGA